MNYEEYVTAAMRTAADLGSDINNLVHAALGLCDESYELGISQPGSNNELEELGDALWFAAAAGVIVKKSTDACIWEFAEQSQPFASPRHVITSCATQIAGLVKKPFAYAGEKPVPYAEITELLKTIIKAIEQIAVQRGWTLEQVMTVNIIKLAERYKKAGFSAENAARRDTEAEALVMAEHLNANKADK